MPTPKNKYDREHLRRIRAIQKEIDAIYAEAVKEAAALGVTINMPNDAKPFTFDDYPLTQKRVDEMLNKLRSQLNVAIVNGIDFAWTLANDKNNELCNVVFGKAVNSLTPAQKRRYYNNNDKARDAFLKRKEKGLNLSDKVWKYTSLFKTEIEMGLDLGIRVGKDAASMARDLKQYLQHPDMLFRRVRDEHGILHLSKRAAAFHPSTGVYRSSYKNARRLAVTETNMAYRTADHERWQQLDFVVGIEINLSSNHTCLGRDGKPHEFKDICDKLKGKYPKDFKFVGWHPHCRCFVTSILKTKAERDADRRRYINGEEVSKESENTVHDVPQGFRDWLEENKERIVDAADKGRLPYFLIDNGKVVDGEYVLNKPRAVVNVETPTIPVEPPQTQTQAPQQQDNVPTFHKCKTVEEYEELLMQIPYMERVDLSSCTVKQAERLVQRMYELHATFPTRTEAGGLQFETWVERAKGEERRGRLGEFDRFGKQKLGVASNAQAIIDRNFAKQKNAMLKREKANIKQMEDNIKYTEQQIEDNIWMGEDDPWIVQRKDVLARMKAYHEELIDGLEEKARNFAPDESETTAMTLEDILNHEFGHFINDNLQRNWDTYSDEVHNAVIAIEKAYGFDGKPKDVWEYRNHFLDSVAFEEGRNISFYATTEGCEYFAEAFAYYCQHGTSKNPLLDNLFNALKKN